MKIKFVSILFFIAILWQACESEPQTQQQLTPGTTTSTEESATTDPVENPDASEEKVGNDAVSGEIFEVLQNYYRDLGENKMDEELYFAPVVEQFYSAINQDRKNIGTRIRGGFATYQKRDIALDPDFFDVKKVGDDYVVAFKGHISASKKDGTFTEEDFHNQFVFSKDLKIKKYNKYTETADRSLSPKAVEIDNSGHVDKATTVVAKGLVAQLTNWNEESINKYIDSKVGFYFVSRPGAFDAVNHCTQITDILEYAPWMRETFSKMNCQLENAAIPAFSCDGPHDGFSKKGCFLTQVKNYHRIHKLMTNLNKYDVAQFKKQDFAQCSTVEQYTKYQLTYTEGNMAILLGQINGKWRILVIDTSSYDCSA